MDLREEFALAVKESVLYHDHLNPERKDGMYYEDGYALPIKKFFASQTPPIVSYEVNRNNRYRCTSICSMASSGRLCYLYFQPKGASFETEYPNDLNASRPTKMDAVIGNENIECKCQEIVAKSHTPLRDKYLQSHLFGELGIKNYETKQVPQKDDATGETTLVNVLTFSCKELGIDLDEDYAHLHFDLKQLICHLIALANRKEKEEEVSLKYVFFTPNKEAIARQTKITQLYEDLRCEIKAIFASDTRIMAFAKKHRIVMDTSRFEFVEIKDVRDFVFEEVWLR